MLFPDLETPKHREKAEVFIGEALAIIDRFFPDVRGNVGNFTDKAIEEADKLAQTKYEDPELDWINKSLIRSGDEMDAESANETQVFVIVAGITNKQNNFT